MKKILVVEDNNDMRENIAEILELANFEVTTAENGKVGVRQTREQNPDLIICDIMMPELDGYGVLHILNRDPHTAGIPFIFLTARAEKSDMRKGMNLGADDYLTKPFEETELLDAVEARLKRNEIVHKEFSEFDAFIDEAKGMSQLENLSNDHRVKNFDKKEVVFRDGDYANFMYRVQTGKVKCTKTDDFGKELVTDIFGPGDFFGYLSLLEKGTHHETAIALEKAAVVEIPKTSFFDLIQKDRDVAYKFIKLLANEAVDKEQRLIRLAYSPVRERAAEALYHLATRFKTDDEETIELAISREDLAGMVGTATETLIRTLHDFKEEELITTSGRKIVVLDLPGLRSVAHLVDVAL